MIPDIYPPARAGAPSRGGAILPPPPPPFLPQIVLSPGDPPPRLGGAPHAPDRARGLELLGPGEPVGQLLGDRLLEDARAGEAEGALGLGEDVAAEHREGGGAPAG